MSQLQQIPQIPFLDTLNEVRNFSKNPIPVIQQSINKFGDTYAFRLGTMKMVTTQDAAFIQHVLQKNHKNYHKSEITTSIKEVIGEGLFTTNGAYWLKQRRLIQPGFHRKKLQALVEIMHREMHVFLEELKSYAQSGKVVDISKEMTKITLRIIIRSLFSTAIEEEDLELVNHSIAEQQKFLMKKINKPFLRPWYLLTGKYHKNAQLKVQLDKQLKKIIQERQNSSHKYDDLLEMLLDVRYEETDKGMTNQQLLDESLTLFVAGHETSANALTWMWYLLGKHPEIQAKVVAETEAILENRSVELADVRQLSYSKQVLQEVMRLYPPAWIVNRVALEDDVLGEYHLPKGTIVNLFAYGAHHNPKYWENPNQFNPDRFIKAATKQRPSFSYFPFGGGPRLCIGEQFAYMEMQLILAEMIRRFRIELVEDEEVQMLPLVILHPKNGIFARIHER